MGFLSYALALSPEAFNGDSKTDIVLVDDCAISGHRISRYLRAIPRGTQVVVATLFSHPELRRRVVDEEPAVKAFYSPRDLSLTTAASEASPEELRRLWKSRTPGFRYSVVEIHPLSFPWSHPDCAVWSEGAQRAENGWRFVAPHRCLRNHCELALFSCPRGANRYRLGPHVWYRIEGERLELFDREKGTGIALENEGAEIVRGLLTLPGAESVEELLCLRYEVSRRTVRRDIDKLLEELLENGYLERDG